MQVHVYIKCAQYYTSICDNHLFYVVQFVYDVTIILTFAVRTIHEVKGVVALK